MSDDALTPYFDDGVTTLYLGRALDVLRKMPSGSVNCCVTSPPYFGLRSYLPDDHPDKSAEIGAEPSPAEFVAVLVAVFAEVRRVLADDGTLWLNLGDSYASGGRKTYATHTGKAAGRGNRFERQPSELPGKNLLGIPWRTAFALQDDGWILRNDIIWCLSGGSWVYARTVKGDMPVMLKDLVRLNPSTVQLWNGARWTQVVGWGPSTDTSEHIELVLRSGERIGATGGHLWPTQRGLVQTRDLVVGDVLDAVTLPDEGSARPAILTDDLLWLVGLYLAEGSRSASTLQLSLHADEERWLPRIRRAVEHCGGSVGHTVSGNSLSVRMWGRVLGAVIDTFVGGRLARDKHFTNAVWALPNSDVALIVDGYLDGDAHYDQPNNRYRLGFTRNYALERDLRVAAARLGAVVKIKSTAVDGHPSFRGEWRWVRSGHGNERSSTEIVALRRSRARQFWDVAVEDDPHTFALASGVLTHNCKPNGMPESVTDRLSTKHEHLFLFAKAKWSGDSVLDLDDVDAAWLAALIDGEGTITIARDRRSEKDAAHQDVFQVCVSIANSSLPLLEKAGRLMGGAHPRKNNEGVNRPVYAVQMSGKKAAAVVAAVKPWLIDKLPQADIALALQDTQRAAGVDKASYQTAEGRAYKERLWEAVRAANRREDQDLSWIRPAKRGRWSPQPYWFDLDSIREPHATEPGREGANYMRGQKAIRPVGPNSGSYSDGGRNPGDVWTIPTQPFSEAHFAVYPVEIPRRAIAAGCKPGGVVLDPFSGSGTTGLAAAGLGRRYVGIDLYSDYLDLSLRTRLTQPSLLAYSPTVDEPLSSND